MTSSITTVTVWVDKDQLHYLSTFESVVEIIETIPTHELEYYKNINLEVFYYKPWERGTMLELNISLKFYNALNKMDKIKLFYESKWT